MTISCAVDSLKITILELTHLNSMAVDKNSLPLWLSLVKRAAEKMGKDAILSPRVENCEVGFFDDHAFSPC